MSLSRGPTSHVNFASPNVQTQAISQQINAPSAEELGQQVYPTGWYNTSASAAVAGVPQSSSSYSYGTRQPQQHQLGVGQAQAQTRYQSGVPIAMGLFFIVIFFD